MKGNQDPRSAPPAMPPPSMGSIGKTYGLQTSETWQVGQNDDRMIVDSILSPHLWRVSVFTTSWVRLDIKYGTSRGLNILDVEGPLIFYAPGQISVNAHPVPAGEQGLIGGTAWATLTPVTSAGISNCRKLIGGAQPIPDNAARFYALDAATVQLGAGGPAVVLALGQFVPLVAGSSLVGGDGYLEFDP